MPKQTRACIGVDQKGSTSQLTWTGLAETEVEDDVSAVALFDLTGEPTKTLVLKPAAPFSIPADATVTAIRARVRRRLREFPGQQATDKDVVPFFDDAAVPGCSPSSGIDTVGHSFGTVSYLWGAPTITPAQVNAVGSGPLLGFGLWLAYEGIGYIATWIDVDYVELEVQYTSSFPGPNPGPSPDPDTGTGPLVGSINGVARMYPQMFMGRTHTFHAQFCDDSGSPSAASGVTYRVYEEDSGTAVATGSMTAQDPTNALGLYWGQIVLDPAAGFEYGKNYCVRAQGTVGSTLQAGLVSRFSIEPDLLGTDPGEPSAPWTLAKMIRWLFMRMRNRLQRDGDIVRLYRDDGTTSYETSQISESTLGANRGNFS